MTEDNVEKTVAGMHTELTKNVNKVIDEPGTTRMRGYVKVTPEVLKKTIEDSATIRAMLQKPIEVYAGQVSELTDEVESSKTQVSELTAEVESSKTQVLELTDEVESSKTQVSDITTKLGVAERNVTGLIGQNETLREQVLKYETQTAEVQKDLSQEQEEHYSVLKAYEAISEGIAQTSKPIVRALPDDIVEPLLFRLYKSGENSPMLKALEFRYDEIENALIEQAEAEDRAGEYRTQYDDVHLVEIGIVTDYFTDLGVAAIQLSNDLDPDKPLQVEKDLVYIKGAKTELIQPVESMEIDHNKVKEAKAEDYIGLKVQSAVKPQDIVYRMV